MAGVGLTFMYQAEALDGQKTGSETKVAFNTVINASSAACMCNSLSHFFRRKV